jgi:hypothetical protein
LADQQLAHGFSIYLPVFHSRIQAWPFALKTLALAQVGERSKGSAGQQSIQRIEQSVATFTKNAPIYRLTKFDTSVNMLLQWNIGVSINPLLPKGGFAQGQDRPQFCLNSS